MELEHNAITLTQMHYSEQITMASVLLLVRNLNTEMCRMSCTKSIQFTDKQFTRLKSILGQQSTPQH